MGWRTKSIAQVQSEFDRGELKRTLGPIHLVLFGIGCIIGAGIFVRTGTAAALYAGPAVMLSFIIAGVAYVGHCVASLLLGGHRFILFERVTMLARAAGELAILLWLVIMGAVARLAISRPA